MIRRPRRSTLFPYPPLSRSRRAFVPDCIRLTAGNVARYQWLPGTCAYRLRAEGKSLPDWHPLLTGDPESVHRAGMRSEEHTSELQSRQYLVCRLLLEKKKQK